MSSVVVSFLSMAKPSGEICILSGGEKASWPNPIWDVFICSVYDIFFWPNTLPENSIISPPAPLWEIWADWIDTWSPISNVIPDETWFVNNAVFVLARLLAENSTLCLLLQSSKIVWE